MKNILLLLLLCPLLCLGQNNANAKTVSSHKQHKNDFRRFEASLYAGRAFYLLPNKEVQRLPVSYHNQVVYAQKGSSALKINPTVAFYLNSHWNAGITFSENNLTYNATDNLGSTVRAKYVRPMINYGVFSNYYFHCGRFEPFAGVVVAALRAHIQEGLDNGAQNANGYTLGANVGLRYALTTQLSVSVMEQLYKNGSSNYLDMMTYSTMAGLSFRF